MNREDFLKKAHAKSAYEGKAAAAGAALFDALLHASPKDRSNFLTRVLNLGASYAQEVLGWDKEDATNARKAAELSLHVPAKRIDAGKGYADDVPLHKFLAEALELGAISYAEREAIAGAAGPRATVGDLRWAFAAAEKLRG